jgi:hypothetical protein
VLVLLLLLLVVVVLLLLLLQAARFAARNIEGITCLAQDTAGKL